MGLFSLRVLNWRFQISAMKCKNCNSSNYVKKGIRNNRQRFYCKDCRQYFQLTYSYQAYKSRTNDLIKGMLKEGCGIRGIARVLNISKNTVLSRMLKISKQIKVPYFNKFGCKFEVDEMFIKIANGKSPVCPSFATARILSSGVQSKQ